MPLINPHINFNGNAKETFSFYKSVFGGEFAKIIRFKDLAKNISTDFHEVFKELWNRKSIYDFGDTQLKSLYDKVMHYR